MVKSTVALAEDLGYVMLASGHHTRTRTRTRTHARKALIMQTKKAFFPPHVCWFLVLNGTEVGRGLHEVSENL